MVNVSETLELIMKEYGLNKTMLSRATGYEYSSINRWCNGVRKPDIDTLEGILNYFGYGLTVHKLAKDLQSKPTSFFLEKSYTQLKEMEAQDLADYVFVTQNDDVLSWILRTPKDVLEYMPLESQRALIRKKIGEVNRTALYFKINNMYCDMEREIGDFVETVKWYLKERCNLPKEILSEVKYLMFNVHIENAGYFDEMYTMFNFKLLDKNRCIIDIPDNTLRDGCLDGSFENDLGEYFFEDDDYYSEEGTTCDIALTY